MPRKSRTVISAASQLQGFKLLERFREVFAGLDARRTKAPRELDPRRNFDAADYFSMELFTLLNPVVDTMRGLCEASKLEEYNRRTGLPKVSLGSFWEAQSVFDPELLSAVLRELMKDIVGDPPQDLVRAMKGKRLEAIDSSVWKVLPRMGWAHWRDQFSTRQNAVRLHLRWRLFEPGVGGAKLVAARECERSVLRHGMLEPGVVYVGDRNYSGDYGLLRRMDEIGASFVVRLQDQSVIEEIERIPVSEKDKRRGITHHLRVALGHRNAQDSGWRLVRLMPGPGREHVVILTNLPLEEIGAWELCEIYKQRWTIELFFRWLKCLLPCPRRRNNTAPRNRMIPMIKFTPLDFQTAADPPGRPTIPLPLAALATRAGPTGLSRPDHYADVRRPSGGCSRKCGPRRHRLPAPSRPWSAKAL